MASTETSYREKLLFYNKLDKYVLFTVMALIQFLRLPFLIASKVTSTDPESEFDVAYSVYEYYLILFIPVCQTIITCNRVTVLWNPIKHKSFWTKRNTLIAIMIMLITPFIGIVQLFLPFFSIKNIYWGNWTRNIGFFLCVISVIMAGLSECRNVQIANSYMTAKRATTEKKLLAAVVAANIGDGFLGECCEVEPGSGCALNPCTTSENQHFECADLAHGLRLCSCSEGWTGSNCDIEINGCDPNPCYNSDWCERIYGSGFKCHCKNHYYGDLCESYDDCDSWWVNCGCDDGDKCNGRGKCIEQMNGNHKCVCDSQNYTGNDCEKEPCATNPCKHGGYCYTKPDGSRKCICTSIWTGDYCNVFDKCNYDKCQNGGTCKMSGSGDVTCTCVNGYEGPRCENITDNCSPNPCIYTNMGKTRRANCTNLIADHICDCPEPIITMIEAIFGRRKTPQELLRQNQRALNKAMRELDRERQRLEQQEKKIIADIKKMAKMGQMDSVRVMAKDLVRTRQYVKKFINMRANIQAVSLKVQTLKSQDAMAQAMKGVTRAMQSMNKQLNLPQIQKIMMEFEKQTEIMDMKEEMMGDAIDDAMGDADDEEETEAVVAKVLDELGIQLSEELGGLPTTEGSLAPAQKKPQPVAADVPMSDADADLQARLEMLRKN
ncbi:hypothetical protein FO519_000972 [Halicephalobus sp. NKZ332]|nr:hypothetical protein FO519_000972 [Halicephalobus sp. NKZ332]